MVVEKQEDLTRPVIAYISFESQEGFERATLFWKENLDVLPERVQALVKPEHKKLLGSDLVMTHATEPRNIIWENL